MLELIHNFGSTVEAGKIFLKKIFICAFALNLVSMPVFSLGFDTSIDDEIRRNYNPSKLEEDMALPVLPKNLSTQEDTKNYTKPVNNLNSGVKSIPKINSGISKPAVSYPKSGGNYAVLKEGTKIRTTLLTNLTDRSKKGTKVRLVSRYPVSTTYFTIPIGTIFEGEIIDSHKPQFTGNGGLIQLQINSMLLSSSVQPVSAYVTKTNSKKIFFNNIKGKRRYIKGVIKSAKPGYQFFSKMMKVSANLMSDGSSVILAPFSFASGVVVLGFNTMMSPVFALFAKGDSIYLKEGSIVEIKLMQDVYIYN